MTQPGPVPARAPASDPAADPGAGGDRVIDLDGGPVLDLESARSGGAGPAAGAASRVAGAATPSTGSRSQDAGTSGYGAADPASGAVTDPVSVTVGDVVLDVHDLGPRDAPVVLLLHGFPQSAHEWRAVWPALLAAGYRVVVPDQRGYSPGARPGDVDAYRMGALVADVVGLLDALSVDTAHVVGHDWGAAVAWQVAGRHPHRVRTLTAVSVPHPAAFGAALRSDPDQREKSQYMLMFNEPTAEERLLADDAAGLRAVLGPLPDADLYVRRMQEPGALTAALGWYRAQAAGMRDPLPSLTLPVLYVWSDGDVALGPVAAHATASYVDGPYRFEVLHGVSHWVPEEAPELLTGLLLEQLALRDR